MSNLSVSKQLSILRRIWGGDSRGYVFMPWIPGHLKTKEERVKNWREVAFHWPDDQDKIIAHLEDHTNDDLFFCPNLFDQPHRNREVISLNQHALYADLDEVDPAGIEADYRPTIAWQTSDGRYQAVWLMGRYETGLTDEGAENQRLTMYLGADKTGWDTTQLLRVPGRKNHKPGKNGQQGVLLWQHGPWYASVDDFENLPAVEGVGNGWDEGDAGGVGEALLDEIDRKAVWRRVRMKVSTRCRDYMGIRDRDVAKDAAESMGEGMSGLLWYVERELADAGCTAAEIIALVRPMPWNKFAGRRDELVRLQSEATKAISQREGRGNDVGRGEGALEDAVELVDDVSVSLDDFMTASRPRLSWLIDRVWGRGTVGFIAGAPKSYKSWVALDMALSVATGTKFLGEFESNGGVAGRVLYVQEEDSDIQVLDRVEKIFWGKPQEIHPRGYMTVEGGQVVWHPPAGERLMRLVVRKGLDLTSAEWQGYLAEQMEEYGYDLVIIDTLGTTSGDTDTDKSREVNRALKPLKILAETYGCAIAVVHHFSKSGAMGGNGGGVRGGHKMLGSVALHAWVETALYVSEKTEIRDRVWRVEIERESKSAQDLRWGLEVPVMGGGGMVQDESGEMVGIAGWAPIVDFRKRMDGDDGVMGERAERAERGDRTGKGGDRTGKGGVWRKTVTVMRGGAITVDNRALTVMEVIDRFYGEGALTRQAMEARLKNAIDAGEVKKLGGGRGQEARYYVCKNPKN